MMSPAEPETPSESPKQRRRYERTKTAVEVELHLDQLPLRFDRRPLTSVSAVAT
jgi:hypothetical protein